MSLVWESSSKQLYAQRLRAVRWALVDEVLRRRAGRWMEQPVALVNSRRRFDELLPPSGLKASGGGRSTSRFNQAVAACSFCSCKAQELDRQDTYLACGVFCRRLLGLVAQPEDCRMRDRLLTKLGDRSGFRGCWCGI